MSRFWDMGYAQSASIGRRATATEILKKQIPPLRYGMTKGLFLGAGWDFLLGVHEAANAVQRTRLSEDDERLQQRRRGC